MSKWIKKGDKVVVIAGNEKGKTGSVLKRLENRIVIQGLNIRKKHMKRTQESQKAQIIEIETPMHISNVALCDSNGKPIRVRTKVLSNGGRDLVYMENGKEVVLRSIKKRAE